MKKSHLIGALCAVVFAVISMSSHAVGVSGQGTWETTLQGRDLDGNGATFEAYYDTVLDITWLADGNASLGSAYDVYSGGMYWDAANAWAAGLDPYGSGITGWRLPYTVDVGNDGFTGSNQYQGVDYGYNLTTHSELSHMFYVTLGNTAAVDTSGNPTSCFNAFQDRCLTNTGPFSNLQAGYWSATEYAPDTDIAWFFDIAYGEQTISGKDSLLISVWAVHDGDIAAVPLPPALWLFGSGLLGLIGIARRRS